MARLFRNSIPWHRPRTSWNRIASSPMVIYQTYNLIKNFYTSNGRTECILFVACGAARPCAVRPCAVRPGPRSRTRRARAVSSTANDDSGAYKREAPRNIGTDALYAVKMPIGNGKVKRTAQAGTEKSPCYREASARQPKGAVLTPSICWHLDNKGKRSMLVITGDNTLGTRESA